jgi:predicted nucleotidyltransferase
MQQVLTHTGLTEKLLKQIVTALADEPKVEGAVLFGSRAKGNFKEGSDIDLALKGTTLTPNDLMSLAARFEELPTLKRIDLLIYNTINEPALKDHIDRVGIQLYTSVTK